MNFGICHYAETIAFPRCWPDEDSRSNIGQRWCSHACKTRTQSLFWSRSITMEAKSERHLTLKASLRTHDVKQNRPATAQYGLLYLQDHEGQGQIGTNVFNNSYCSADWGLGEALKRLKCSSCVLMITLSMQHCPAL